MMKLSLEVENATVTAGDEIEGTVRVQVDQVVEHPDPLVLELYGEEICLCTNGSAPTTSRFWDTSAEHTLSLPLPTSMSPRGPPYLIPFFMRVPSAPPRPVVQSKRQTGPAYCRVQYYIQCSAPTSTLWSYDEGGDDHSTASRTSRGSRRSEASGTVFSGSNNSSANINKTSNSSSLRSVASTATVSSTSAAAVTPTRTAKIPMDRAVLTIQAPTLPPRPSAPLEHLQSYEFANGTVALGVRFPNSYVSPGENLTVELVLQNRSHRKLKRVQVQLVQQLAWKQSGSSHPESRTSVLWESHNLVKTQYLPATWCNGSQAKDYSPAMDDTNEAGDLDPDLAKKIQKRLLKCHQNTDETDLDPTSSRPLFVPIPKDALPHYAGQWITCQHFLEVTMTGEGMFVGTVTATSWQLHCKVGGPYSEEVVAAKSSQRKKTSFSSKDSKRTKKLPVESKLLSPTSRAKSKRSLFGRREISDGADNTKKSTNDAVFPSSRRSGPSAPIVA